MSTEAPQTIQEVQGISSQIGEEREVNIYPVLRSILLSLAVIIFIVVILYLLYLNGKSVYESGV